MAWHYYYHPTVSFLSSSSEGTSHQLERSWAVSTGPGSGIPLLCQGGGRRLVPRPWHGPLQHHNSQRPICTWWHRVGEQGQGPGRDRVVAPSDSFWQTWDLPAIFKGQTGCFLKSPLNTENTKAGALMGDVCGLHWKAPSHRRQPLFWVVASCGFPLREAWS